MTLIVSHKSMILLWRNFHLAVNHVLTMAWGWGPPEVDFSGLGFKAWCDSHACVVLARLPFLLLLIIYMQYVFLLHESECTWRPMWLWNGCVEHILQALGKEEPERKQAVHTALPSAPHYAVLYSTIFGFLNFLSPSLLSIFRDKVLLNIAQAVPLSPK